MGCNCGGRRNRQVQVMDTEQAQAIVDQQAVGPDPSIVDPAELVPDIR